MLLKSLKSQKVFSLIKLGILCTVAFANSIYSSAVVQHKSLSEAIAYAMNNPNSDKHATGRRNNLIGPVHHAAEYANQATAIPAAAAQDYLPPLVFLSPLPTTGSITVAQPTQTDDNLKKASDEEAPTSYGKVIKPRTCECQECRKTLSITKYKAHMRAHRNLNRFKCSFPNCSYEEINLHNAARHYSSHIRKAASDCLECSAIAWPTDQKKMPLRLGRHIKKAHIIDKKPHK